MATKLNDGTEVALPLRNIISMIAITSIATWAYFGIVERLNGFETTQTMMKSDLNFNTEFRIKWPRGEMGSLPADSEQFMMIEHLAEELEKLTSKLKNSNSTAAFHTINFLVCSLHRFFGVFIFALRAVQN